jgi:hypothetical protein
VALACKVSFFQAFFQALKFSFFLSAQGVPIVAKSAVLYDGTEL